MNGILLQMEEETEGRLEGHLTLITQTVLSSGQLPSLKMDLGE